MQIEFVRKYGEGRPFVKMIFLHGSFHEDTIFIIDVKPYDMVHITI